MVGALQLAPIEISGERFKSKIAHTIYKLITNVLSISRLKQVSHEINYKAAITVFCSTGDIRKHIYETQGNMAIMIISPASIFVLI